VRMPLRKLRPSRTQFTLRAMMVAVAIAGLILGFLTWFCRWAFDFLDFLAVILQPNSLSVSHEVIIYLGPYGVSSTSPAFWPTLCLLFAVLVGISVGIFRAVLFAAKAIGCRITRKA
jgi:hypothetical protein